METPFIVCAAAGGTVLVMQFILGLLGIGSEHGLDHGHEHGGGHDHHHESDHTHGASWFAGLFTFRTITAGLTFFGLAGMATLSRGADDLTALAVAVLGGALAMYAVAQIMKWFFRLSDDGTVRIERTVGEAGTVYIPIPGKNSGPGKVTVTVQKRTMEYAAFTPNEPLPTGTKVRVTAVRSPREVEVVADPKPEQN